VSIPENSIFLVSLNSGIGIPEFRDRRIFKLLNVSML
jgi:hypothetical protein